MKLTNLTGGMKLTNLTPHTLDFLIPFNGRDIVVATLPSEGTARARQQDVPAGAIVVNGFSIPVVKTEFGETEGLPEPEAGIGYVVSIITANAALAQGRNTSDLYVPSGLVRNDEGQVIGCKALARHS